jgi:hypothetical protein
MQAEQDAILSNIFGKKEAEPPPAPEPVVTVPHKPWRPARCRGNAAEGMLILRYAIGAIMASPALSLESQPDTMDLGTIDCSAFDEMDLDELEAIGSYQYQCAE